MRNKIHTMEYNVPIPTFTIKSYILFGIEAYGLAKIDRKKKRHFQYHFLCGSVYIISPQTICYQNIPSFMQKQKREKKNERKIKASTIIYIKRRTIKHPQHKYI